MKPKTKAPAVPPLARVKNPTGRVDLLLARILATAAAKDPRVAPFYAQVQPHVENLLRLQVGPRTKRGKQIAGYLFEVKAALEQMNKGRAA